MKGQSRFSMFIALSTVAASMLGGVPAAQAGTYAYYATKITLNGAQVSAPKHIVAVDPWSKMQTSFVPVWYVDYALGKLGVTATWDGNTGQLNLTVPTSMTVDTTNAPAPQTITPTTMSIAISGTVVGYAPRIAYTDPDSGQATTFVPVYYVEQAVKRLGVTPTWDGTTWGMTAPVPTETQADMANAMWNLFAATTWDVNAHPSQSDVGVTPSATTSVTAGDVATWLAAWAGKAKGYTAIVGPLNGQFVPFSLQYECSTDPYTWAMDNDLFQGTSVAGATSTITAVDSSQIIANLKWWLQGIRPIGNGKYQFHVPMYGNYGNYVSSGVGSTVSVSQYQTAIAASIHYMDEVTFSVSGSTLYLNLPNTTGNATDLEWEVMDGTYFFGWNGPYTLPGAHGGSTLQIPNNTKYGLDVAINGLTPQAVISKVSISVQDNNGVLDVTKVYDVGNGQ